MLLLRALPYAIVAALFLWGLEGQRTVDELARAAIDVAWDRAGTSTLDDPRVQQAERRACAWRVPTTALLGRPDHTCVDTLKLVR
jgi:hypothetical protein